MMIQKLTQKQRVYYPWVIYRQTAMGYSAVSQFRNRKDAEDYLKTLRQLSPATHYELAFEKEERRQEAEGRRQEAEGRRQ